MPNEFLDRRVYPLGWAAPGFSPATPWPAAVAQPAWTVPLYSESGAPPVALVRRSACNVTRVNASRQILDFGQVGAWRGGTVARAGAPHAPSLPAQEFMGGVNLTFPSAPAGALVTVTVAEELLPGGSGVLSPARTGNRWASTWTLAGDASLDAGVHHHEFIQFRYAQVDGSPVAFAPGDGLAQAWVVQVCQTRTDCGRPLPSRRAPTSPHAASRRRGRPQPVRAAVCRVHPRRRRVWDGLARAHGPRLLVLVQRGAGHGVELHGLYDRRHVAGRERRRAGEAWRHGGRKCEGYTLGLLTLRRRASGTWTSSTPSTPPSGSTWCVAGARPPTRSTNARISSLARAGLQPRRLVRAAADPP